MPPLLLSGRWLAESLAGLGAEVYGLDHVPSDLDGTRSFVVDITDAGAVRGVVSCVEPEVRLSRSAYVPVPCKKMPRSHELIVLRSAMQSLQSCRFRPATPEPRTVQSTT